MERSREGSCGCTRRRVVTVSRARTSITFVDKEMTSGCTATTTNEAAAVLPSAVTVLRLVSTQTTVTLQDSYIDTNDTSARIHRLESSLIISDLRGRVTKFKLTHQISTVTKSTIYRSRSDLEFIFWLRYCAMYMDGPSSNLHQTASAT